MKYRFKRRPRVYQLAALKKALELDNAIALWFDPGLGKTKVAIDFAGIKRMKGELNRILVVCPLSAVGVWEDEMLEDMPDSTPFNIVPLVGDMDDKINLLKDNIKPKSPTMVIVNYDAIINRRDEYGKTKDSILLKLMLKFKPELLIVDEMHYTKNAQAQRTKSVYKIRKLCRWVIGLTGTPFTKNPLDAFGQFKILDDTIFGTRYSDFKHRYAIYGGFGGFKIIDWQNLDEMAKKIHSIAVRVKDNEAELPELIVQDIPVYFSKETKEVYKQMAKEMIVELDNMETVTAAIAAVKSGKLQQICGGFLMRTDVVMVDDKPKKQPVTFPVGTEKLDVFMDLIDKYIDEHKIIVGCRFIWEINQIRLRLEKKFAADRSGYKVEVIRGGVSAEERTRIKRDFQSKPGVRVIIFQVSAATAMTLTAADIGILYSCTRKWDDYWQWLKRIHREGQTRPVKIYRLLVRGTVDYDMVKSLKEKRQFTEDIIDKSQYRQMLTPKF